MCYVKTYNSFSFKSDIDECSADSSPCDLNADCTNSDGSYSCACKQGFTGDGSKCEGTRETGYYHTKLSLKLA